MTKPLYIMNEPGITVFEKQAVFDGIQSILILAKTRKEIVDWGTWNTGTDLAKQYQSVDWYLEQGRVTSSRSSQLNSETIVNLFLSEPWRQQQDHYDILITHQDLYFRNTNFVIGSAIPHVGTLISTHRFRELNRRTMHECIKTEVIHEVGHVFGLPNQERKDTRESLGQHCTNVCIMRQGLIVPRDWINMTNDRIKYGPLCGNCQTDLLNYFQK